ncbi:hypothetical protein T484DRAFT_1646656, partial [Baffinella frigidus]
MGYTGNSDGVACSACVAGTFKSVVGTGQCNTCSSNAGSSLGSALCQCLQGFEGEDGVGCSECLAGYTMPLNSVVCVACEAGTFKSVVGTASCETCPPNSESPSGSALCQCSAGFTGTDGGLCSMCLAGTYKATAGSASCVECLAGTYQHTEGGSTCTPCPSNTFSLGGSNELVDCKCNTGHTAASDGMDCSLCE